MTSQREEFIKKIIKEKPDMKVLFINQVKTQRWSSEKIISELNPEEKTQVNLRKQFSNEVLLDIEEKYRLDDIKTKLNKKNWSYEIWDTGSRGIHISIKFTNLAKQPLEIRNRIRKHIISLFETDDKLAKENQWMAMEWSQHFKTGNQKIKIDAIINDGQPNKIEEEIINYCIESLETQKQKQIENKTIIKDFHKNDPYLNYVLNNVIEDGDRNMILFKNLAIGLSQSGLSRVEIEDYAKRIVLQCPGKNPGEFMGWVDKVLNGELTEYNKSEMMQWSIHRGEKPLYKLESDEELIDLYSIKQLWDEIWHHKVACQEVYKDLCFYNLLGTILDEKEFDYRIHLIFTSFTSTGKDEGMNIVKDVLDRLQYKNTKPNSMTDRTLVGSINQSAIDYNVKWSLSEDDPEKGARKFKDPVEQGILATYDWIGFGEAGFVFKPGTYNKNVQSILRQVMDKARIVDKGVGGFIIPLKTNTSIFLTTYRQDTSISNVLHNGLFQRCLYYNKEVSNKEHKEIREFINNFKEWKDEEKYMLKFINKLKKMKNWYDENRTKIEMEENINIIKNKKWDKIEKDYEDYIDIDKKILNSIIRRASNNLYKLSILYATWNMKNFISHKNIDECFKLIRECISSVKEMVISQDKSKKRKYIIFNMLAKGSIPSMVFHNLLEEKLKIKSSATKSKLIKQYVDAEYITKFREGRNEMLLLTEKGKEYLLIDD